MKDFSLDPKDIAALLGVTPEAAGTMIAQAQAEIDRNAQEIAADAQAGTAEAAKQWAELGCRHGYRGPYWARWTAIQDARSLSLRERLQELPPGGSRWVALWARNAGDLATFAAAYDYFLHLRDTKGGPVAHENSFYFEYLYSRAEYQKICDTVTAFFSDHGDQPGMAGYLYEKVWWVFASAALRYENAVEVAEKLAKQFPKEGGAWAALAVARASAGDAEGAGAAWTRAIRCKYLEDGARRVALDQLKPSA